MPLYSVVIIRPGREADYWAFWKKQITVNDAGEELHSDLLSFAENISGKNAAEAVAKARAKYPGHTIDSEATNKLG